MGLNSLAVCRYIGPSSIGCNSATKNEAEQRDGLSDQVWLEPVRSMNGITGRSVLSCSAGDCIILHYPPGYVDTSDVTELLADDPNVPDDEAQLYNDPDDRWCQPGTSHLATNTFNCCTYAVGDVAGLTIDDWIIPEGCGATYYTVPMQVILDSFFERIRVYKRPIRNWDLLVSDTELRAGDVLCCVNLRHEVPAYAHAGRICKKANKNWVRSKFGSGPIIESTIQKIATEYSSEFDEIWVYRVKRPKRRTTFY